MILYFFLPVIDLFQVTCGLRNGITSMILCFSPVIDLFQVTCGLRSGITSMILCFLPVIDSFQVTCGLRNGITSMILSFFTCNCLVSGNMWDQEWNNIYDIVFFTCN
jgi:hypothetical protein